MRGSAGTIANMRPSFVICPPARAPIPSRVVSARASPGAGNGEGKRICPGSLQACASSAASVRSPLSICAVEYCVILAKSVCE